MSRMYLSARVMFLKLALADLEPRPANFTGAEGEVAEIERLIGLPPA